MREEPKAMRDEPVNQCATERQSARAAIQEEIELLHKRAMDLDALLGQIPVSLSPGADRALWHLVMDRRR